jgi:hypothetical protein
MLNPFFLQGTSSEQGLVQDLINEQLKMYGIEVYYMPREIITEGKVIKEVLYSTFTNQFPIEAYLASYEGFDSNSILMSKFGVRITDEMNLIISKERFETYIGELMKQIPDVKNALRPNEGDLIYIPLSESFMEIKYVENRKPFYQLQKNYVYELRCELFEIEDENIVMNVSDPVIAGKEPKALGYESELQLSGIGVTATASTTFVSGGVQTISTINGGYRYSTTPSINVSSPLSGTKARVVGIMTSKSALLTSKSVHKIYIEDPGTGYNYSKPPLVTFSGGGGYNASATVGIATSGSIGPISLTNAGQGYVTEPTVTISGPVSGGTTATARAFLNSSGGISTVRIINAGYGYTTAPNITISAGSTVSNGNYIFGETVTGSISGATGLVKDWDAETKILKVSGFGTAFVTGDVVVGAASTATYIIKDSGDFISAPPYDSSDDIQEEFDDIVEFTEVNPFGEV